MQLFEMRYSANNYYIHIFLYSFFSFVRAWFAVVSIHPFFFSLFCSLCCFLYHWRSRQSLKVREHKVLGPYVDGLSQLAVTSFEVCLLPFCHQSRVPPVSLIKSLVLHTPTDMIYSMHQRYRYIISPIVKPLIYKKLCWGVFVMWEFNHVVCLPGRAFLNSFKTSPPCSSVLCSAWY